MKGFLVFLFLAGIVAVYVVLFDPSLLTKGKIFLSESVCDVPITYHLGNIDPKFAISSDLLLLDTKEAADAWNIAIHKDLFQYDPQGKITINLVYDNRQGLTSQINNLENSLKQDTSSLKPQIAEYQKQVADFERRMNNLNSEIDHWNAKGGAPKEVYNDLIARQKALRAESMQLNQQAQKLNLTAENFNEKVATLNNTITTFNNTLQQEPEEGIYDPNTHTITIYFFNNKEELVHTLAHELGHARGLPHVNNQASLMYAYTNTSLTPNQADIYPLERICQQKYAKEKLQEILTTTRDIIKQKLKAWGVSL